MIMRKINNQLVLFGGIIIFLSLGIIFVLQKFLVLPLTKTIYLCQSFISSMFSFEIPHYLSFIPYLILFSILLTVLIKLVFAYRHINKTRIRLTTAVVYSQKLTKILIKLNIFENTLLVKDNTPFAFCFGIRNPKIYISTAMLKITGQKELEAILLHEKHHLQKKDTFTMLLASVSQSLFPFFPLISDLLLNFKIEKELQADREVIRQLGTSKSLISVLRKLLSVKSYDLVLAASIAEGDTLEPRIQFLLKSKDYIKKFQMKNIAVSLFFVSVFVLLLLTPVEAVNLPMQKDDTAMICLEGQACASWCKSHNSVAPYSIHYDSENNTSYNYSSFK